MTREDFSDLVRKLRQTRPVWFDLPSDAPPPEQEIAEIERGLGAKLPADFVWFLKEYGGGDFGLATIYSADRESEFHLLERQEEGLPDNLVVFSDNGAGDLYGFPIDDGVARDEVLLLDHETGTTSARADGFLDFVREQAFNNES
jgi:hypothetical protein